MTKGFRIGLDAAVAALAVLGIILTIMAVKDYSIDPSTGALDTVINLFLIMIGICALVAIGFGLYALVSDFKNNKKALYGIVGLIVIAILGYLFASDFVKPEWLTKDVPITEVVSKRSGAGLITSYLLAGLAVLLIIGMEIKNAFK